MANPFIGSTTNKPAPDVLAALQPSMNSSPAHGDSFSRVFEQRVRDQPPARSPDNNEARTRETPSQRQNGTEANRSERSGRAERPANGDQRRPSAEREADSAQSPDSRTEPAGAASGQPDAQTHVPIEDGQDHATGNPASLAAIAAILAAMNRNVSAGVEEGSDPLADGPGRRSGGFQFLNLGGHPPRPETGAKDVGFDKTLELASSTSTKAGSGKTEAPLSAGTGSVAQVQNAVLQAGRFAQPAAASLQSSMIEVPTGGLPAAGVLASLRGEASSIPQLQVPTPAGQRVWAEDVGNRMIWMVGRGESRAELVLTPPSLGKLGVSIQVNGDQTSAHFVAATSAAREALEQAMPRLREVLQQAGINLGQTNVSTSGEQQARDQANEGRGRSGGGRLDRMSEGMDLVATSPLPSRWSASGSGMIDTFA